VATITPTHSLSLFFPSRLIIILMIMMMMMRDLVMIVSVDYPHKIVFVSSPTLTLVDG